MNNNSITTYIATLENMVAVLRENMNGQTIAQGCRKYGLDYQAFFSLFNSKTFEGLRLREPVRKLEEVCPPYDEWEKLYMAVFDGEHLAAVELPRDYRESMNTAMAELTDREKDILWRYVVYGDRLEDIGNAYGVTRERIWQVREKALRKLRAPSRRNRLILGNAELERWEARYQEEQKRLSTRERGYDVTTPIKQLDFSTRTFNCLARSDYHTVEDIMYLSDAELLAIRNMGKKSVMEIRKKLAALGVEGQHDVS